MRDQKAYQKAYYEAHKAQKKAYSEAHKEQRKATDKAYYEANKEHVKERKKAYYEANKEQIVKKAKVRYQVNKEQVVKKTKAYYQVNKEQRKVQMKANYADRGRDQNIKKTTGDPSKGLHWYNGLLDLQGHVCAICHDVVEDATGKGRTLHVDHCHETGQARELLCSRCNSAIGCLREREDLCDAVKAYLQKHKRRVVHEERRTLYAAS